MEVFLERLLLELVAVAVQLAIVRLVAWLRARPSVVVEEGSITVTPA